MLEIYILVIAYFVVMFTVIALLGKYTVLDMDIDLSDSSEAIFAVYIGLVWPFHLCCLYLQWLSSSSVVLLRERTK